MARFTDEDLAHMTKKLNNPWITERAEKFFGLLARLEAAELCAEAFASQAPDHEAVTRWRQATGK